MYTGLMVGHAGTDPKKALHYVLRSKVDILFIDMEMPSMKGLDFLAVIKDRIRGYVADMPPLHVVVCSAHRKYALDGFDHHITDYLLKPFSFPRFVDSMDRIKRNLMVQPSRTAFTGTPDHMFIRLAGGRTLQRVDFEDIIYLEAHGNECKLWFGDAEGIEVSKSLKGTLDQLPREDFVQVHRSHAVAYRYVDKVAGDQLKMKHISRALPLGEKRLYAPFWNWVEEVKLL